MKTFREFNEAILSPTHKVIMPIYFMGTLKVGDLVNIHFNTNNPNDVICKITSDNNVSYMPLDGVNKHFKMLTPLELKSIKYGI